MLTLRTTLCQHHAVPGELEEYFSLTRAAHPQMRSARKPNSCQLKVKAIYDDLIKDLNLKAEEVPLLAGELVNADQGGACASMNSIINELPKAIPNSYIISSKGCTSRPDHLHFNAAGYRELGMRYGLKMLSLLGYKVDEPE